MKLRLEKDRIVEVYIDPLTRKRSEGKARLVERIGLREDLEKEGLENWRVVFLNDESQAIVDQLVFSGDVFLF